MGKCTGFEAKKFTDDKNTMAFITIIMDDTYPIFASYERCRPFHENLLKFCYGENATCDEIDILHINLCVYIYC